MPTKKDPEKQSFFKGRIKLYFKLQALDCNLKMLCALVSGESAPRKDGGLRIMSYELRDKRKLRDFSQPAQ